MKKVLWLRHKESTILFNLNNLVDQAYCMGKNFLSFFLIAGHLPESSLYCVIDLLVYFLFLSSPFSNFLFVFIVVGKILYMGTTKP